ncbi:methyltransferase [Kordia sp.]|uniref:methyltransferase n=1 Tax=Kordia sp. TaxID=1965332 RepID=UPI003D6A9833
MDTVLISNKPTPIIPKTEIALFYRGMDIKSTIKILESGKHVLITEFYSNGLELLKALHVYLKKKMLNGTFLEQRKYRSVYQRLSNLILIEITNHKLVVKKSPVIGWLEKLYPENKNFFLPLSQIQGLNSAWQWYKNGISIPVLRNKLHPYYGVYFPTRFEHLELFDNWLKRYKGSKKTAIDIGFGSGVLSFQLIKHGFQKVFGTDTNPNAVIGLRESMGTTKLSRKIEVDFGNLFGKWEKPTELIVFNPPWLPTTQEMNRLDEAMYYPKSLFPDFFKEAKKMLLPDGKLVLIFSNLGELTNATSEHPIEKELAEGGRFQLERCFKKSVKAASKNTKRDQHWRAEESVELWVLTNV